MLPDVSVRDICFPLPPLLNIFFAAVLHVVLPWLSTDALTLPGFTHLDEGSADAGDVQAKVRRVGGGGGVRYAGDASNMLRSLGIPYRYFVGHWKCVKRSVREDGSYYCVCRLTTRVARLNLRP